MQHIKAVTDLWKHQKSLGRNSHENPRSGQLVRAFITRVSRRKAHVNKTLFKDKGTNNVLNDGYNAKELLAVSLYFFENTKTNSNLWRSRLDFLLSHAIMGRGEDLRNCNLSDLYSHLVRCRFYCIFVVYLFFCCE